MLDIDGSRGEGGGQILRTSLSLSLVTGLPFRIGGIRARRNKPGLLRQHLTAVKAAVDISGARVSGAELGSQTLTFEPAAIRGGDLQICIGSAGSVTLVLQTILPALLWAATPSRVTLEGGTHNPMAPPYDFVANAFVPALRQMGVSITVGLERFGFYPAGGGLMRVEVEPWRVAMPLTLEARGPVTVRARALVAALPETIGRRELTVVRERLGLDRAAARVEQAGPSIGPGNALLIAIAGNVVTEVVTAFGEKGVSAETVAHRACDEAERFLRADVPVGPHLADQLLIPMALGAGGTFRTLAVSDHTRTNADVIGQFLAAPISITRESDDVDRVRVGGGPAVAREGTRTES